MNLSEYAYGQEITHQEWKKILANDEYIIGLGISEDIDKARQVALSDLSSKISVHVQSQISYSASEEMSSDRHMSEEKITNVIKSYSSGTLRNVREYAEKSKNEYHIYRYLKRSDIDELFKKRVKLARKWLYEGRRNEKDYKIGDALQDYYWSLVLLRSCPDGEIEMIEDDYGEYNMMQHLHNRVKNILSGIEVNALSAETDNDKVLVTLNIKYKGFPIANLNYSLANHNPASPAECIYVAKDGLGEILLPADYNLNRLKLNIDYECRNEAYINPDLRSIIENTARINFPNATIRVDTKGCPAKAIKSEYDDDDNKLQMSDKDTDSKINEVVSANSISVTDKSEIDRIRKIADDAYNNKHYLTALENYMKISHDCQSQVAIAHMHHYGYGVEQNYTEANKWYKQAAEQGNAESQRNMGIIYENGYEGVKDYAQAIKWYLLAADQGDRVAEYRLGNMYYKGNGFERDHKKAFEWFRRSAEKDYSYAQFRVGYMYESGEGVTKDFEESKYWYELAAKNGSISAKANLGYLYFQGRGVKQDYVKAVRLFRQAADKGNPYALYRLGEAYHKGKGVDTDLKKAGDYMRESAEMGFDRAQCQLGNMLYKGIGMEKNLDEAKQWYKKAADQGYDVAIKKLKELDF